MQPGTKVGLSIIGIAFSLFLLLGIIAVARYNSDHAPRPKKSSEPQTRREDPPREQPKPQPRKATEPEEEAARILKDLERDIERQSTQWLGITLFVWGWICFGTVAFFVVSILIIVVLAKDVRARAPDQVPLWCLLFLFGGMFSVIFWLAARPPLRPPDYDPSRIRNYDDPLP